MQILHQMVSTKPSTLHRIQECRGLHNLFMHMTKFTFEKLQVFPYVYRNTSVPVEWTSTMFIHNNESSTSASRWGTEPGYYLKTMDKTEQRSLESSTIIPTTKLWQVHYGDSHIATLSWNKGNSTWVSRALVVH